MVGVPFLSLSVEATKSAFFGILIPKITFHLCFFTYTKIE